MVDGMVTDRVIARRGTQLLVGDPAGQASIVSPSGTWSPPFNAQSVLARGYWRDPEPGTPVPTRPLPAEPHGSLGRARAAYAAAGWDESLHPSAEHGRFGEKAGDAPESLPKFEGSVFDPVPAIAEGKASFMADHGLGEPGDFSGTMVDPAMQHALADAYDALPLSDDAAFPAYDQLAEQVDEQYRYLTEGLGVHVEFLDHDPYPDGRSLARDLAEGHLGVLSTSATGSHAYLSDEVNDRFRAVHDAFGHAAIGRGFDRNGEEAAFQSHAEMFTGDAVRALAMETRGQNAVLIVRGDFPPQKVGLLPEGMESVSANHPTEMPRAAAAASADDDNLYELGGTHHASQGRWLQSPTRTAAGWDESLHPREHGRFSQKAETERPAWGKRSGLDQLAERRAKYGDTPAEWRAALESAYPNASVTLEGHARYVTDTSGEPEYVKAGLGVVAAAVDLAAEYPEVAAEVGGIHLTDLEFGTLGQTSRVDSIMDLTGPGVSIDVEQLASAEPHDVTNTVEGTTATDHGRLGYGVFVHEFGHVIDDVSKRTFGSGTGSYGGTTWARAFEAGERENGHISKYSMVTGTEYFAEAFAAERLGFDERLTDADRQMLTTAGVHVQTAAAAAEDEGGDGVISDTFEGSVVWDYAQASEEPRTAAGWDESLHPRDRGRFAEKAGGKAEGDPWGDYANYEPPPEVVDRRAQLREAESRIREALGGGTTVQLEGLDPKLAPALAERFEALARDFPGYASNIGRVSLDSPYGGGIGFDALATTARMEYSEAFVTLNVDFWGSTERLTAACATGAVPELGGVGFHPAPDWTSVVDHEFAHVIDQQTGVSETYREQLTNAAPNISGYAEKNPVEAWAELFAAGRAGVALSPEVQDVYDKLVADVGSGPKYSMRAVERLVAALEHDESTCVGYVNEAMRQAADAADPRTAASWDESLHPRDRGRFAQKEGESEVEVSKGFKPEVAAEITARLGELQARFPDVRPVHRIETTPKSDRFYAQSVASLGIMRFPANIARGQLSGEVADVGIRGLVDHEFGHLVAETMYAQPGGNGAVQEAVRIALGPVGNTERGPAYLDQKIISDWGGSPTLYRRLEQATGSGRGNTDQDEAFAELFRVGVSDHPNDAGQEVVKVAEVWTHPLQSDAGRTAAAPRRAVRTKGPRAPRQHPELARARRLLDRLSRLRRDTGRQLLAGAEIAFAEALRNAGVRATTKARNRSGKALAATVASALEGHHSLSPFFAALGVDEAALLTGSFGSYQAQARAWLARRREEQLATLEAEGWDDDEAERDVPGDDTTIAAGAAFLGAALLALARHRVLSGQDPVDLSGPGEVSGTIPAQLAAQAMRVAEGSAVAPAAASPDLVPAVSAIPDAGSLELTIVNRLRDALSDELHAELVPGERAPGTEALAGPGHEYLWAHGFYGEPRTVFEPHDDLDGELFTDTEHDERLINPNPDGWPAEMLYPGDHRGCSCELVLQVGPGLARLAEPETEPAATAAAGWAEDEHPRDDHGEFAIKPGAGEHEDKGTRAPGTLTKKGMVGGDGKVIKPGDRVTVRREVQGIEHTFKSTTTGKAQQLESGAFGVKLDRDGVVEYPAADVFKGDKGSRSVGEVADRAQRQADEQGTVNFLLDHGKKLEDDTEILGAFMGYSTESLRRAAAYDETEHPRAEGGRWTKKDAEPEAPPERDDHGMGTGTDIKGQVDDEYGEGTYDDWAANAPPGMGVEDWRNYTYASEDGGPSESIRLAEQAVARGYEPSGDAAVDALKGPDEVWYGEELNLRMSADVFGSYGPAGVVGDYIDEQLQRTDLDDDERAELGRVREVLAGGEDSPELREAMAENVLADLRQVTHNDVETWQPVASVAAILETGVIGNEAMFGGEVGNFTGTGRADEEYARIGVDHDAKPEDRPVYASFSGDEMETLAAGLPGFGECVLTLGRSVLDRSTIGLGDLLHVPAPIPYRDIAGLSASEDADRILAAAGTAATQTAYVMAARDMVEGALGVGAAEAFTDSVLQDNIEWAQWRGSDYPEVQVHGGVGLGDVTSIGLPPTDDYVEPVGRESRAFVDLWTQMAEARGAPVPSMYDYSDALSERHDWGAGD